MNERTFNGFMLSAALHGLVAALLFVAFYLGEQATKTVPKVLELVAGEGDNYGALEAPALGTPGGVKLAIPDVPAAKPLPPEPAPLKETPPEPVVEKAPPTPVASPVTKAPAPTAEKKEEPIRDFKKDVIRIANKRAARLEAIDKKKREAEERKAKEDELKKKRMTKEEFDRQNRAEKSAKSGAAPKYSRLDAEGIAKGVVGASTANKVGGAGGKALTRDEGDVMDAYFSLLKQRMYEALEKPPGLSDALVATAEFRVAAGGGLSGARIERSSGSPEFDQAVLEAIGRVRSIGPRPDGKTETVSLNFRMKEED